MTLTDFLLARIAEDEERFAASPHDESASQSGDLNEGYIVALHGRLRAECEAKRRIVEEFTPFSGATRQQVYTSRLLFSLLALPCADHPDYREEWRP